MPTIKTEYIKRNEKNFRTNNYVSEALIQNTPIINWIEVHRNMNVKLLRGKSK